MIERIARHATRTLVTDTNGSYTGQDLLDAAASVAAHLPEVAPGDRVGLLAEPGLPYVAGMIGIWMRGAMAVPLSPQHPAAEIAYAVGDSGASAVLSSSSLRHLVEEAAANVIDVGAAVHARAAGAAVPLHDEAPALMLYTSGTTGRPKGVVHTHATVRAMVTSLVEAWELTHEDRIIHFLPLHHLHGIVNKLLCPLWAGPRCDMLGRFDAVDVFDRLAAEPYTIFMAVPTVYAKLVQAWEPTPADVQQRWSAGCRRLRVMISGSAALPLPVLHRWHEISGHVLLERYGMTEVGIVLTNPLHGERRPGFVGTPVPGMSVRLVDDDGGVLDGDDAIGELHVRGANVFREYWGRPDATAESFTDAQGAERGWFRTGDLVALEHGAYRIAGRLNADIIKSGGYKISGLEIESVLAAHPAIVDSAIVGVEDDTWGERIAAVVVLREGSTLSLDELRSWASEHLGSYKLPTRLAVVDELPRNVMGKVLKPERAS